MAGAPPGLERESERPHRALDEGGVEALDQLAHEGIGLERCDRLGVAGLALDRVALRGGLASDVKSSNVYFRR